MTKVCRDGPVRGDEFSRPIESFPFHPQQYGVGPEIREGRGFRMSFRRLVQTTLQFPKRPTFHQDVKSSPSQHSHLPKVRKEILGHHEMTAFGRKLRRKKPGKITAAFQEGLLADGSLGGQASLPQRLRQGENDRTRDFGALGNSPGVVGFSESLTIERNKPAVVVPRMSATPFVELRPITIQHEGGMPLVGGMIGNRRRMAKTGGLSAGQAIARRSVT